MKELEFVTGEFYYQSRHIENFALMCLLVHPIPFFYKRLYILSLCAFYHFYLLHTVLATEPHTFDNIKEYHYSLY